MKAIIRVTSLLGLLSLCATNAMFVCSNTASAQNAGSADTRERARAAYSRGQERFRAGDFAASETAFREAYAISPNAIVLKSIAESQERRGNAAGALATWEQYLSERPDASDRADVEARMATLRASATPTTTTTTTTTTTVPPSTGVAATTTTTTTAPPVATTTTQTPAPAVSTTTTTTTSAPAEAAEQPAASTADNTEAAVTQEPDVPSRDPSTGFWVATGFAAAGLIAGSILGFMSLSELSSFDSNPSAATADRGSNLALFADLSFGVAAIAGLSAIILWITEGQHQPRERAATTRLVPRGSRARSERQHVLQHNDLLIAPFVGPSGGGGFIRVGF